MVATKKEILVYENGDYYFRMRLILATIFQRQIRIKNVHLHDGGLRECETLLLKLLDMLTDGAEINVDVTGTIVTYRPGLIIGCQGKTEPLPYNFDCGKERNISYYLEALAFLAPFAKAVVHVKLKGITHGGGDGGYQDPSVDHFRSVFLPFATHLGFDNVVGEHEGCSPIIKVIRRGFYPEGGGEVEFFCPSLKKIPSIRLDSVGRVKRVRGIACSSLGVNNQFKMRMVGRARRLLNDFLPDVWIYDAKTSKATAGPGDAMSITLLAETMQGAWLGADLCVDRTNRADFEIKGDDTETESRAILERRLDVKELLKREEASKTSSETASVDEPEAGLTVEERAGYAAASRLLLEIRAGGIIDSTFQHIPLVFMAAAEDNKASKVRLGPLTATTISLLRHLKDMTNLTFLLEIAADEKAPPRSSLDTFEDLDSNEENQEMVKVSGVTASCVGIGLVNISRRNLA